MTRLSRREVICPKCGTIDIMIYYASVNTMFDSSLINELVDGTLNTHACSGCGHVIRLSSEVMINCPQSMFMINPTDDVEKNKEKLKLNGVITEDGMVLDGLTSRLLKTKSKKYSKHKSLYKPSSLHPPPLPPTPHPPSDNKENYNKIKERANKKNSSNKIDLSKSLETKLNNLIAFFMDTRVVVAFSGGVDSSLLAFLSNKYAKETLLVTEKSILYPDEEIKLTSEFANKYGITHLIVERNPLKDENFRVNPKNRCYICKTGLYKDIIKIKEERNFDLILDGSNIDDLSDYRPGMQALKELNITTPYIDFKINKQEIREICKHFNLEVQSKPSMACFSSRIPYDQEINEEKLDMIREAEMFLRNTYNLNQFRVRLHEGKLARIELMPEDIMKVITNENIKKIKTKLKQLGFCYITIDLEGFRSGSLNEILSLNKED